MNPQQLQGLMLPLGFLAIFYMFAIRPQRKKDKQIKEMRNALRAGDEIVTIGGIHGKILKVKEDYITLEVGSTKTRLEVTKWAIASVVNKNESKNNKKDEVEVEQIEVEQIEDKE